MGEYIELISQLKPKNGGTFPIADVNDLRGGYIQVNTITEMEGFLTTSKLKEGMLCYVKVVTDNIHMYQYLSGTWTPWVVSGGGGSGGASIKSVETLVELEDANLKIKGQLVFVDEISDLRYYNGIYWESFSRIYIQSTPPQDKGGIWIDTSDDKVFLDSNGVIQNLLQVITILQEKVKRLEWAFNSQMDFGNFTNNKYYEYDGQTEIEPSYGTSVESDMNVALENIQNNIISEVEPIEAKSLLPNGRHLSIKSGTYAEMLVNKDDFLSKELLWCYDKQQLWIKDPKTLKLIQIGSSTGGTPTDETMDQILTEVIGTGASAKTKITGIEFADMADKNLTYLIQVKDGKLDVHDYRLDQNNLAGNAQVVASGEYYSSPYFPINADNTGNTTSPMIYINMIYCGNDYGNKDYNPCSHNFVELCNLSNEDLNLKGLYLHYTERGTNSWISLPLYGVIKTKGTFLIKGAQCSVIDVNTTYLKVSTSDMEWSKSLTYNNSVLEIDTETEIHSVWDINNLIKFSSNCSFYISGEPSVDYYKTNILNISAPWSSLGSEKWYVDLVGIGSYNAISLPCEATAIATNNNNRMLMRYYNMDHVSQAIKALSARKNSSDWTYINLASINPSLTIEDYRPKASFENKDIFFDKHLLKEGTPNIVTCSFGHNAHTTRCFNWVSMGYYDEYIWFSADGITFNDEDKFQSFKTGDGRTSTKNWNNAIYDRIRSLTTDGTAFTVHKFIKDFTEPIAGTTTTWYYKVGRDGYYTNVKTFTLRNREDVITNGYNYLQVTDQQGFNGEEYETWRLSAEYINQDKATNGYDFCINTGDATQNGNRVNEWIDYFNAGKSLFDNTEQMYTVGNNDLCPLDVFTLGVGDDLSKVNPINVQYFFTFEHPYTIPTSASGIYIPCVYSFVYGNTYFLSMNSEITESARVDLFGDVVGVNIYTTLKTWCDNDLLSHIDDNKIIWKIAFCHEAPFTIITANQIMSYVKPVNSVLTKDPTITRGGSHLNTVGNYWFSQFLQNNNFKLCIGGHKHTYSNSRYLREDPTKTMEPIVYDATYIPDEGSGATYPGWYTALPDREKMCVQLTNDNTKNYVKYIMCQSTGYKLISNKELPAKNIPWLMNYYPSKTQVEDSVTNTATVTVEPAQQFPNYIIWNVGTGIETEKVGVTKPSRDRIKGLSYKVVKTATPTTLWSYKYNTPVLLSALSKASGNGSTNSTDYIIVE